MTFRQPHGSAAGSVHPHAAVHPTAVLGANVRIGAFAVVEEHAVLGDGCMIACHAVVRARCRIGNDASIDSFAVVGGMAQMRSPAPPTGHVLVGDRAVVREGVTIHLPTRVDGVTTVGADCLLMANSHVGHDSQLEDFVTLANNVMLAGHVQVGRAAFLGGGAGVHQFVRIGAGAIVGGNATISYDVAPFVIAADRNEVHGLNLIGLRRQGITAAALCDLKRCYHAVFGDVGDVRRRAAEALDAGLLGLEAPGKAFLEFFAGGRRGFSRARARAARANGAAAGPTAERDPSSPAS